MKKKNFGLNEEDFQKMLIQLKQGDESMFEQIFLSHFKDCMDYLKANYNTGHELAYDMSMDTLIDFRKSLINDKIKYGNLRFLFTKMASQKFMKYTNKHKLIDTNFSVPDIEVYDQVFDNEELEVLDKAWGKLGEECKKLLKQFYYEKVKLIQIAELQNKTAASIRKQKERCVNALRINFQQYVKY